MLPRVLRRREPIVPELFAAALGPTLLSTGVFDDAGQSGVDLHGTTRAALLASTEQWPDESGGGLWCGDPEVLLSNRPDVAAVVLGDLDPPYDCMDLETEIVDGRLVSVELRGTDLVEILDGIGEDALAEMVRAVLLGPAQDAAGALVPVLRDVLT